MGNGFLADKVFGTAVKERLLRIVFYLFHSATQTQQSR